MNPERPLLPMKLTGRIQEPPSALLSEMVLQPQFTYELQHLLPHYIQIEKVMVSEDQLAQMCNIVIQALAVIGIQTGVTHTEVKWLPERCAIIEINARLAGGMIPELIRLATGTDVLEQQMRSVVGGTISLDTEAHGVAGIQFLMAEREGILLDIEGVNEAAKVPGVKSVQVTAKVGALVQPPQNAYHRLGYVIAHTDTTVSTQTCLQEAINRIRLRLDNAGRPGASAAHGSH